MKRHNKQPFWDGIAVSLGMVAALGLGIAMVIT